MYNTKGKTQKAYSKNKPTKNIIPKNCVAIFPIELVGGKTMVSNQGIMPGRKYYDKGSFLYWQEVFDGRSALKIMWEASTWLVKPENENYYRATASVGNWYYGKPISMTEEGLEVSEDESFEDFLSLKANQSITLYFEYTPTDRIQSKLDLETYFRFKLVDNDIYNLYQIPEICEQKLMYIQSHNEIFDDLTGLSKGCQITFASLGDKIQKSGKAIEQYCSWNAPGEFAVKPKIWKYYDEEGELVREVDIDPIAYYYPTPIKYLQVEQQGPALTSTIYALGRRQEWDETNQCWVIRPSKILLPCQFITTQPNPLNRTSTPSKNFFFFHDEQVSFTTTAKFWELITNTAQQPLEKMKNGGLITLGTEDSWESEEGVKKGLHKSNQIQANGTWNDYFSDVWFPTAYLGENQQSFQTNGCIYCADTMAYTATDTMIDILCKNAFIFNQQPIIPLSMSATRPYYLRDIPLIGSIANFFKLGDFILNNHTTNRKASNLAYFCDCSIAGMCANQQAGITDKPHPWTSGQVCFPINFFGNNETQWQKLGVNSANTTFCFQLTDQVLIDGVNRDTILLAQTKNSDGSWIFENHQPLLANSTIKPIVPPTSNFIIDAVVVQSIFDGKIKISCFSEEEEEFIYPQWTATILSNAAWEGGAMRDWTNFFPLSNWEERFCIQQDEFNWPEKPYKPSGSDYTWNISAKNNYEIPFQNYWQNVSGVDWNNTIETQVVGRNAMVMNQGDKVVYEGTIAYTDLGAEGVSDKDTFINAFSQVQVDCSGSFITLQHIESWKGRDRTYNIKKSIVNSINFVAGTYTYEQECEGVSLRWEDSPKNPENNHTIPTPLADFIFGVEGHLGIGCPGAIQQRFKLKIELLDQTIKATITRHDKAYGFNNWSFRGDKKVVACNMLMTSMSSTIKTISNCSIKELIFKKK